MKNSARGFTLLEVMVTIGIFGLVLSSFMVYYSNEIRQYYSKENTIELRQSARIALDRVATKIRSSVGLAVTTDGEGNVSAIKDYEDNLIINTGSSSGGEINYDSDKDELVDGSGNKIAGNITDFTITPNETNAQLLAITIKVGNARAERTTGEKSYTTAVRLH